jgi:hypothetical protein
MRIDLYKFTHPLTFDLAARLQEIEALELSRRNRDIGADFVRLEAMEIDGSLCLTDFVKVRTQHGPAKAAPSSPVCGFGLTDDEGFGEETALLWDSSNDWCVIQYNHYSLRAATIADYLARFDRDHPAELEFQPKIDEQVHAKLRTKKIVTKVLLTVAPKKIDDKEFEMGASLGEAVKLLKTSDGDQIEIVISTRRRKKGLEFDLGAFEKWVTQLGREKDGIHSARITAKERAIDRSEVLDLLHHHVTTEADLQPGPDKRYPRTDRWKALRAAHRAWRDLMRE